MKGLAGGVKIGGGGIKSKLANIKKPEAKIPESTKEADIAESS